MIRAVILTHGTLGQELMAGVQGVLGPQADVTVLSNNGMSLDQIIQAAQSTLSGDSLIFFVDFCGGSPYVACKTLQQVHPECAIISGVNMPMLFSFFTKRNQLSFRELVEIVESDAHRGIQRISS
jgi:mannose/fructose-specific phosphotransferase system component IIA